MAGFALPAIGLLAGLFNKPKPITTKTDSSSSGTSSSQYNNSTMPVLSDLQSGLAENFIPGLIERYRKGPGDLKSFAAGKLGEINKGADINSKIASNIAAAHGLSYSPAGTGTLNQIESSRVGQGTDLLSSLPLLQRQQENDDFTNLMKAFGILPTGQVGSGNQDQQFQQSGQQNSVQTSGQPNQFGSALSGLGQGLFAPINGQGGSSFDSILNSFGGGRKGWTGFNAPGYQP